MTIVETSTQPKKKKDEGQGEVTMIDTAMGAGTGAAAEIVVTTGAAAEIVVTNEFPSTGAVEAAGTATLLLSVVLTSPGWTTRAG